MTVVSLVHHKVADFDAWKAVYDGVRDIQRAGGVRHHHVWRSTEDPSLVVVVHTFDDAAAASAFFENPKLQEAMGAAGVEMASFHLELLEAVEGGALG